MTNRLWLMLAMVGCASDQVVIKKLTVVRNSDDIVVLGLTSPNSDTQRHIAKVAESFSPPLDKGEILKRVTRVAKSSVLIVTEVRANDPQNDRQIGKTELKFCSGSLIDVNGEPRILTNQHCFAKTDENGKNLDELLSRDVCAKIRVYFNFSSTTDEVVIRRCQPGTLRTDYHADLALFALNEPLPAAGGFQPLEIWQGELKDLVRRNVFTIHHPGTGERNALPLPDIKNARAPKKMITIFDCFYLGGFSQKNWDRGIPYQIRHTCDLMDGSSGSGLIDLKSGKLLGVNVGSVQMRVTDSGNNQTEYTHNVATVAKFLHYFIAEQPLPEPQTLVEIPDPDCNNPDTDECR